MNSIRQAMGSAHQELASFALLHLDQTRLLIPQNDVRVLDLTIDVIRENPPYGGVGWITFRQQQCPVYALSPQLEWLPEIPAGRTFCALIEADTVFFGVLCTEVAIVKAGDLEFHEIPAAMTTPDFPIQQLAIHQGKLVCLSSAAKIHTLLPPLGSEQ